MSEFLEKAVEQITEKMADVDVGGTVKFVVDGEGAIFVDESGARIADDEADVTMTADGETFEGIFTGDVNPTGAFMSGKLTIDGDLDIELPVYTINLIGRSLVDTFCNMRVKRAGTGKILGRHRRRIFTT